MSNYTNINRPGVKEFEACKRKIPTDAEIIQLISNIKITTNFLRKVLLEQNSKIKSPDDLKAFAFQYSTFLMSDSAGPSFVDSQLYELQAFEYILKNPSIIGKKYESIKDKSDNHICYDANMSRSINLVLVHALAELRGIEELGKEYANHKPSEIKIQVDDTPAGQITKRYFPKIITEKNLEKKLLLMINCEKEICESNIRAMEIRRMKFLGDFFVDTDFLPTFYSQYISNSKKFGFGDLTYDFQTNKYTQNEIGLVELFTEDFLKTLSTRDLCFLATHWNNRFSKCVQALADSYVAIDSMNLWDSIFNLDKNINVRTECLAASLQKSYMLSNILTAVYVQHQDKIHNSEMKKNTTPELTTDYLQFFKNIASYLSEEYNNYFSSHYLYENDLIQNVGFIQPLLNLEGLSYRMKSLFLQPLVKTTLDNPNCKNWGIVRNELRDGKFVDTIASNSPKVLVAFDVEGFNMPFRFHIPKSELIDIIKLNNPNCLIPEYQGNEDFIVNNELVPANIIMPIQKRSKETIINNANNSNTNRNFWEHIYFLQNSDKFPKHLTVPNKNGKGTSRIPIIYTSLLTGKRFEKDKRNCFTELGDEGR